MKQIASISGGKDSVAMCLRLLESGEDVHSFVFADTGVEFPECYEAIRRFREVTGREVVVLKREGWSFEWAMIDKPLLPQRYGKPRRHPTGYLWPSMLNRWCTSKLKRKVLLDYAKEQGDFVELIGIAADEPKRVREHPRKRYPLVEWGMTEADCLAYCRERGFFRSPCAYDEIGRMSCYLCPLQNLRQVRYLVTRRPELWSEIKRLEGRLGDPWKRGTAYYEQRFAEPLLDGVEDDGKEGAK